MPNLKRKRRLDDDDGPLADGETLDCGPVRFMDEHVRPHTDQAARDAALSDRWRNLPTPLALVHAPAPIVRQAKTMDAVYAAYDARLRDAWKGAAA